nr:immunoglobulin light chain junction region [Macaca mulatta]MOW62468.1 immunoglobulin light chain junction region [Macaca mulatta]MOW62636.1 immunoglobulin light chain junction region [Macaca mulatta]MOW62769.1 immunoglobulin light chain junction region [Macaca mulatta]MOW63481.1 immunoglobulin light chain junction region [Macaca mulatta]
CQQYNSVPWTF